MLIKVHAVITGTCKTLYRWGWIPNNPAGRIRAPQVPKAIPYAPTTQEVVLLVNAAFEQDADCGTTVWRMLVTTGRRGEIVRTQTKHINFDRSLIFVPSTKIDGSGRWVAIDKVTLMLLTLQVERIAKRRAAAGLRMTGEEYLYSYDPTHETHGSLDYYTERFTKMSDALGIKATPHDVRHYGATELIANGVDVVSAARRLGHSRPSTTSDVYAAWRPEADSRSAGILAAGLKLPAQYELPRAERGYAAEQPNRTSPELEERICSLRRRTGWGPKRIREHLAAEEVSVAESTIWKVLDRYGLTGGNSAGSPTKEPEYA
ncbi:tyrosine-type recombinase/integrase [Glycomyces sp. NPDC049804]|uniref:tyrosine-type recombinase/integrase n=1 Tax=Glycomyces sp. NPDC049804 TaxID=3154363 RepID=UPI0034365125